MGAWQGCNEGTEIRASSWHRGTADWAGLRTGKVPATAEPQDCQEKLSQRQSSRLGLGKSAVAVTGVGRLWQHSAIRECCSDSGDWEGRSGTLWESYRIHQVSTIGRVTNPASKTSPLDGLRDRILGLDGTTARNLNYSPHSAYLSPNHLCEKVIEKMSL